MRHRRCGSTEGRLEAYLDGELPGREARAIEKHLAGCAACAEMLARRRALREAVRDHFAATPPVGLREAILEEARSRSSGFVVARAWEARQEAPAGHLARFWRWSFRRALVPVVGVAAAVLLVASITWLAGRRGELRRENPFSRPGDVIVARYDESPGAKPPPEKSGLILEEMR